MRKAVLFCIFILFIIQGKAQDSIPSHSNLDFYFRGGFLSEWHNKVSFSHFQLDEARLHFYGNYNESLSYHIRFRLNKPFTATSLDNATSALDFAFLSYRFGASKRWGVSLGKLYAMVGSYELDIHPLYEFIYADHLGYITRPFIAGVRLDVLLTDTQNIGLQLHNTVNNTFEKHLQNNGFSTASFSASKTPIGAYAYWQGKFAKGKLNTHYSYNISQFANGYYSHSIALGHQYKSDKHNAYLDLMYAKMGADYPLLGSKIISDYEGLTAGNYLMCEDITYKGVVGRYEYLFTDCWSMALKAGAESVASGKTPQGDLRYNYIYSLAALYAPIPTQNLHFYVAYAGNTIRYPSEISTEKTQYHSVSAGAYYSLPLLKNKTFRN